MKTSKNAPAAHGVGRRKTAVARVWLRRGKGNITVNGRPCDAYFDTEITRLKAKLPAKVCREAEGFDVGRKEEEVFWEARFDFKRDCEEERYFN